MADFVFGQYVKGNSWIYRLDARFKIVAFVVLIIAVFMIRNVWLMAGFYLAVLLLIMSARLSVFRFFKAIRPLMFLMVFTFFMQMLYTRDDNPPLFELGFYFNLVSLILIITIIVLFFYIRKVIPFKFLLFLTTIFLIFLAQYFLISSAVFNLEYQLVLHERALITVAFVILRIMIFISLSSLLTFTTMPLAMNDALESLLKPLKLIRFPVSELTMMFMLCLRLMPMLYLESRKIMKAQASRGVDFKEGGFKQKIVQIISLLIPMLVLSVKRAFDLADAMECRGYVIGAPRTKYEVSIFRFTDVLILSIAFLILGLTIFLRFWL
ncbi:MAG: energy-coupling factor transporter transmembrane protein EcfT [Erysipelotrichales bacterium]|nr:energy-coupling factor transporter transmembrane protein EcfT [Erysipelotrichales bacterium]